jgi:F0F1-type ATP synthase delta subunit
MKDSKTKLSEKEKAEVTAKLQKFVSENLGLNEKEIKEISAGNISLETRMKIDAALDKIIKAEGN